MLKQDIKDEFKDKIKQKLNEIQDFKNEGIKIRTKNPTLNTIYKTGKILDKKEETKNGNSKFINKINGKTDKNEILNEALDFYKPLYTKQDIREEDIDDYLQDFNPNKLTENEKEDLNQLINNDEILNAIQQLSNNKSPELDGLTAESYKIFRYDIVDNLNEIFNNIL